MAAGGESVGSEELAKLGAEFIRITRRTDRLRRQLQAASNPGADGTWQAWSETIDAALILVERIDEIEATNLETLVIKFYALSWRLTYDDALLDRSARRRITTFGRELAMLARRDTQE